MYVNLEPFLRFSFEYRNTKTKVITTANQKTHKNVLQRNNRNHVKTKSSAGNTETKYSQQPIRRGVSTYSKEPIGIQSNYM